MKIKNIIIFSAVGGMLVLGGCKDSFLEQNPPLSMGENDIYGDPARIESTVRGLYAAFKNTGSKSFMGGKTYLAFDARGEDIVNISSNNVVLAESYNMRVLDNSAENEDTWTYGYQVINKVNTFLEKLEGAKDIVPEQYEQYKAEAKFLRAISYYYLVNLYSMPYSIDKNVKALPLRLTIQQSAEGNDMPRSTITEVYNQILDDVSNISALPTTSGTYESVTRATQAAANMLRMRVYMAMEDWNSALTAGQAISGYELVNNVAAPFEPPFISTENIFSLPMASTNRPNTQQSLPEYYYDGQIFQVDLETGIASNPNYSLEGDKRIQAFFGENGIYMKYMDAQDKSNWAPIYRYAETLLNMAECCINLGNSAQAKIYLKQVRERSVDSATDPLKIDNLNDSDLRMAIYNEKRLETMGEAIRSIDILRRGETFTKGKPGVTQIVVTPTTSGYIWPYPQSEVLTNKLLLD